jgi:hypothetical protein
VDGLPTWVRWIIVLAVGLSPILTFWMARVIGPSPRRKLRRRSEIASQSESEQARDEPEREAPSG